MYTLNSDKMFYDIAEGQAIVINIETGMYYGASLLGSYVLDLILNGNDPDAITAYLKTESDCPNNIAEQIDFYIKTLLDYEIILQNNSPYNITLEAGNVQCNGDYNLEINEFAEVQDLLLADPVHDVDTQMGWPKLSDED